MFVNDRLVVDLGGVHNPATGSVDLDSVADDLDLEVGETYPLDFFFVERHIAGSTFSILTSLQLLLESVRASVWDGLREPGAIGFDGKRAAAAVALASLLLLIVFPAELFNGEFEEDDPARDGKQALRDVGLVAGIALVAWFLWALVHTGSPSRAVPIHAVEATLVNLYGIGWAGLLLGLLPLRFLPGRDLYEWRKGVWAAVTGAVAAGLLYTSALPDDDGYDGSLALVLGLLLGFSILSVGFWAYFRFGKPKETPEIAVEIPKADTATHR